MLGDAGFLLPFRFLEGMAKKVTQFTNSYLRECRTLLTGGFF
jgi:hypothetical protein